MKNTTNFNFKKPELSDVINPDVFNANSDSIDKILFNSSRMEVAQGTSNEIILTNYYDFLNFIQNFFSIYNQFIILFALYFFAFQHFSRIVFQYSAFKFNLFIFIIGFFYQIGQ